MKKYIFGAILSIGLLVSPAFTQAAGLNAAQISAIISLLQSFGADQSVINNVQASLTGGTTTSGGFCYNFNTDLTVGSSGADVVALHRALSASGIPTSELPSVSGNAFFTEQTAADVVSFQAKYGIRQTGYVGPITRAKLNSLYGCSNPGTSSTTFSASPTYGNAPLAVSFSYNLGGSVVSESGYSITFGDGTTGAVTLGCGNVGTSAGACPRALTGTHTYTVAGTYTAQLMYQPPFVCNAPPGAACAQVMPALQVVGTATITVTSGATTQAPTISLLSPSSGQIGTTVRINGVGFDQSAVAYFNGYAMTTNNTYGGISQAISFVVPSSLNNCPAGAQCFAGPTQVTRGAYNVQVVTAGGKSNVVTFTVSGTTTLCPTYSQPYCPNGTIVSGMVDVTGCYGPGICVTPTSSTISSLSPSSGPIGTTVRINGAGFATSNSIYLNDTFIESQSNSSGLIPTALIFTIPSSFPQNCNANGACSGGNMISAGTYNVKVVNANGSSNSIPFTVTSGTTTLCPKYMTPYCPAPGVITGGGVDANGCSLPGTCTFCPDANPPYCPSGTIVGGGVDINGCTLPGTCVPPTGLLTFSASPTSGTAPLSVRFTSNVSGGILNFGDGASGTVECAIGATIGAQAVCGSSHTYTAPGTYTATLQSLGSCGKVTGLSCTPETIVGTVDITVLGVVVDPIKPFNPTCPKYMTPYCPSGTFTGGGVDANGCYLPGTCVPLQTSSALDGFNSATQANVAPTATNPNFSYSWNNNLEIGSSYTADVRALQTALTHEGLYTGEITGGFFNQTFTAVKAFQQKYGIEATGFVGSLTRAKLNTLY